jgi:YHS domain-containing protein
MRKIGKISLFFVILVSVFCFNLLFQQTVLAKEQANCPIMGGKIDKSVYTDHEGKRVYFCCAGCIDAFKKDPEKHVKKMEDEGVDLEKIPETKSDKTQH